MVNEARTSHKPSAETKSTDHQVFEEHLCSEDVFYLTREKNLLNSV